jgi:beta-phosphoglucomutase
MTDKYLAAIFDLDGVLVNTAEFHYRAWKVIADRLGAGFTRSHNERLKGVSRAKSLDILLETCPKPCAAKEKAALMEEKNGLYVDMLQNLSGDDLLAGSAECLNKLRARGVKTALGSASKNAPFILEKLGIQNLFDAVIDGNTTRRTKPDPEVFTLGADALGVGYNRCVVFEDALAGIQAALSAGMLPIGIGEETNLPGAHRCIGSLSELSIEDYF